MAKCTREHKRMNSEHTQSRAAKMLPVNTYKKVRASNEQQLRSFYGEICSRTTKATTNLIIAAINVYYLERITQTIIDFIYVPYKMEQRHKRGKEGGGEGKSAKRRPIKARPFSYFRHISNISQLCNVSCVVSRYWLQMISFAEFSQISLLQRANRKGW